MSKHVILAICDGVVACNSKSKTRIPDVGPISEEEMRAVALSLFEDFQHITLDQCEFWVEALRKKQINETQEEIDSLHKWIADLQSGMFINCVYCGHRYGPRKDTLASMADVLKEHIEQCPKHPMSLLKKENVFVSRVSCFPKGPRF